MLSLSTFLKQYIILAKKFHPEAAIFAIGRNTFGGPRHDDVAREPRLRAKISEALTDGGVGFVENHRLFWHFVTQLFDMFDVVVPYAKILLGAMKWLR